MLRTLAYIFSAVFHPMLMVTYMLVLLLLINPYQFGVYSIRDQTKLVLLVFLSTFAMPAFAVVMMKSLNMVKSFDLRDRHDRIGPYIITGTFYLWMFINFKNNTTIPMSMTVAMLGAAIGLFLAFFVNNFTKISAHAIGMGGLTGMAALNCSYFSFDTFTLNFGRLGALEISTSFILMISILIAGAVCTSRLLLKAHTPGQVYAGLAGGFLAQMAAFVILV